MTSRHYWPNYPGVIPVLSICGACHAPLVPGGRIPEFKANPRPFYEREDCPGRSSVLSWRERYAAAMPQDGPVRLADALDALRDGITHVRETPGETQEDTMAASVGIITAHVSPAPFSTHVQPSSFAEDQQQVDDWANLALDDLRDEVAGLTLEQIQAGIMQIQRVADEHDRRRQRALDLQQLLRDQLNDAACTGLAQMATLKGDAGMDPRR